MQQKVEILRIKSLSLVKLILSVIVFPFIYTLFSKIRFYLPWTEVPITLQTTGILFSPFIIGEYSILSVFVYLLIGSIGLPVFSGDSAGLNYFLLPTGGYLFGFLVASFFLSKFLKNQKNWNLKRIFFILVFVDIFFIFIPGSVWYGFVKKNFNILFLIKNCILPFIPGDFFKIYIPISLFSHFMKRND